MKPLNLLFSLLALFSAIFAALPIEAKAQTYARDGDTIVLQGQAWRLNGVNCPELKMLGGQEAKAAVETVMAKGTLSCAWNGDMTYDRKVGRCTAEIEEQRYDIGSLLIVSGVCGRCPRFDTDGFYLEAQSIGGYKGPFPQYCHG